ncbi:MAG: glycoside hydrolase family 43 protein [Stackebrandtia sp.]
MSKKLIGQLAAAAVVAMGAVITVAVEPADAAAPRPVHAPGRSVADPGLVRANDNFYSFTTGRLIHVGETASGTWTNTGSALATRGKWAKVAGMWAPDAVKTSAGWVLYYSAPAKRFGGQHCIGVATAKSVTGPFRPSGDTPLVCPGGRHGAKDKVTGRPVRKAGVSDPSPFQDSQGRRYLLYKTQKTPSTLRMLRLNDAGTNWVGNRSRELVQRRGVIENPVMVQRGSRFVLFASRYRYHNCSYATVYFDSGNRWKFAGRQEHNLLSTNNSGICGPGGADVVRALGNGWRVFLHGWVCGSGTEACKPKPTGAHRRALYAAVLKWDGATPRIGTFL